MMSVPAVLAAAVAAVGLAGCGGGGSTSATGILPPGGNTGGGSSGPIASERRLIKHIVVIYQENRTFDNMFNGYPGADTAQYGTVHTGQVIPLQQISLSLGYNIAHKGKDYFTSYNKGAMNGFDLVAAGNVGSAHGYVLVPPFPEYAYVPPAENKPYWLMASQYTLADRNFASNLDSSFVSHQYLIRGQANSAVDNPGGVPWGCDTPPGEDIVPTLLANQKYGPFESPCFDGITIGDELDAKGLTWTYYAPEVVQQNAPNYNFGEVWSAYGAIRHIRYSKHWGQVPVGTGGAVHWPETDILKDVPAGKLADVTWITPKLENSDHPSCFTTNGPSWVASIVNTIGQSQYWKDTAIIVEWDDSGGWYDHVAPPQLDFDGLGFRTGMMMLSPYAKHGYISHVQYETGSILKFMEDTFGLASMAPADTRANDYFDMFDFTQTPRPFTPIPAPLPPSFFLNQQPANSYDPPDNE
jgi:phospholipase C